MGTWFQRLLPVCIWLVLLRGSAVRSSVTDATQPLIKLTSCAGVDDDGSATRAVRLAGHAMIPDTDACEGLQATGINLHAVSSGGYPVTADTRVSQSNAGVGVGCNVEVTAVLPVLDVFVCAQTKLEAQVLDTTSQLSAEPGPAAVVTQLNSSFCSQPACEWYATGMPVRGNEGLVTQHSAAKLGLLCSHAVEPPVDCLRVEFRSSKDGMQAVGVEFRHGWQMTGDGRRRELTLEWEPSFRGVVSVDIQEAREQQQCDLRLGQPLVCPSCDCSHDVLARPSEEAAAVEEHECHDGMKVFKSPAPIAPVTFTVVDSLPLRTLATSVPYGCSDDQWCGHSEL